MIHLDGEVNAGGAHTPFSQVPESEIKLDINGESETDVVEELEESSSMQTPPEIIIDETPEEIPEPAPVKKKILKDRMIVLDKTFNLTPELPPNLVYWYRC